MPPRRAPVRGKTAKKPSVKTTTAEVAVIENDNVDHNNETIQVTETQKEPIINEGNGADTIDKVAALRQRLEAVKRLRSDAKTANKKEVHAEKRNRAFNGGSNVTHTTETNLHNPQFAVKQEQMEARKVRKAQEKLEELDSPNDDIVQREIRKKYTLEEYDAWKERNAKLKETKSSAEIVDYDELHGRKYHRQVEKLSKDGTLPLRDDPTTGYDVTDADAERLANIIKDDRNRTTKFSRRRTFDERDEDVNYINDANMRYNKKLQRAFGADSKEIKDSLERGTAL